MANFEKSIKFILEREGKYVDHPNDKGGPTNQGLTLNFLKDTNNLELCDLDNNGIIDGLDVKLLDKPEEAKPIYKTYIWDKYSLDKWTDNLGLVFFDAVINHGPKNATKFLQKALNFSINQIDGIFGKQTLNSVLNINNELDIINNFINIRIEFYNKIVANNPSQKVFLKGWLNRMIELKKVMK